MRALTETAAAGWPLAAALAVVVAGQGRRAGRRREALNRAMHELRRPLQALVLTRPGNGAVAGADSVRLAVAALAQLDREINGGSDSPEHRLVACRTLLGEAVARWRSRAAMTGGSIELRWRAGSPAVLAEPAALSQAFDNLIVNAIEHGGPRVVVEAVHRGGRLLVLVGDSGVRSHPEDRRETPGELVARLTGRRRHGYGLEIVRGVARSHGGRFALRRTEDGSLAVLELPVAVAARGRPAA